MTTDADPRSGVEAALSLADLERLAAERMEPAAWDYVAGGAEDELTLLDNVAAFRRRRLLPRVLRSATTTADTRTTVLGREVGLPIGVSPVAAHALADPDGEVATARAAAAAGAMFCLSTVSSRSIEEVAAAVPDGPRWFQLYVNQDVRFTRRLVERAEAAGYGAIVVTVDLPVLGYREREKRRGFELGVPLGNFIGHEGEAAAAEADTGDGVNLDVLLDQRHAGLTWEVVGVIRSWTSLPLIVKGILHPDDARLAVEHGAAGVMVSNHGGRQLDRSPAALDALEPVVAAVDGRAEVYLDGGPRRGADALIALALGARVVFTGRPFIYGLGAGGEAGVGRAFAILREELERSMALLGVSRLDEVTRDHVLPAPERT